jgi:transglutaminase-like putative cysteine protease
MQLRVTHVTGYQYDGKATASYNLARLTPRSSAEQIVVHSRIDVSPTPYVQTYRDYFGAEVTAFEVLDPHDELTVTATSTVHTHRIPAAPPVLAWDDLSAPEVTDRHIEYLAVNDLVRPPAELASLVGELRSSCALPGEAARELCALVNREVTYEIGSTEVETHAADAWRQRAGVCQDLAHLAIGGLRTLGIPARYVSGYQHPKPSAPVGEAVRGESHAWVEWWDDGWHPFDPTNDHEPGDRYVVVATGRDYGDVKPLSGIYSGGATSNLVVDVHVTQLA